MLGYDVGMLQTGVLIAIEGIDGAGKTTQADILTERLRGAGFDVVRTKEPTNGPWGQRIRATSETGRLSPDEELDAFIKDRQEHVRDLINPSLAAGKIVILDRYYFSTAAYQGARGMDVDELLAVNEAFAPRPDLLVLLEVTPRVGISRIRKRGDKENLFEREENLAKAGAIFATLKGDFILRVDGLKTIEQVTESILRRLVEGSLYRRLCLRSPQPAQCEGTYCASFGAGCDYPGVLQAFPDREAEALLPEVQKIVSDLSLTPEQRVAAIQELARTLEA